MANSLTLFPSRVRFVNNDGTLTPEAYRALLEVSSRINSGSSTGDTSEATFASVMSEFVGHPTYLETVTQTTDQANVQALAHDIAYQTQDQQVQNADIMQPQNGVNASITSANLVGKVITVTNGVITGFI